MDLPEPLPETVEKVEKRAEREVTRKEKEEKRREKRKEERRKRKLASSSEDGQRARQKKIKEEPRGLSPIPLERQESGLCV